MDISLGERDLNVLFGEAFVDSAVELVEGAAPFHGVADPAHELKVEGGLPEEPEADPRLGFGEQVPRLLCHVHEHRLDLVDVAAIGHAHIDPDSTLDVAATAFVGDFGVSDGRVRNDDLKVVPRENARGADADVSHLTPLARVEHDEVAMERCWMDVL